MTDPETTETRDPRARSGIIIALGALGLLLVLLFFQSSPSTDLPPDQGPMAMALVSDMMTNGVLVDYDCAKNDGVGEPGGLDEIQLRAAAKHGDRACDGLRHQARRLPHHRSSTTTRKREIAAFDGKKLTMDNVVEPVASRQSMVLSQNIDLRRRTTCR